MKKYLKLFLLLLAVYFTLAPSIGRAADLPELPTIKAVDYSFLEAAEQHIFQRVNELRKNPGSFGVYNHPAVHQLQYQNIVRDAARYKALYVAAYDDFSHSYNKGPYAGGKNILFTFSYWGENIAANYPRDTAEETGEQLFKQWLNSPGHLANMMNSNFTFMGIGVVYAPSARWQINAVQQFGSGSNPQLTVKLPNPLTSGGSKVDLPSPTPTPKPTATPRPTSQTNNGSGKYGWKQDSYGRWQYILTSGTPAKGWFKESGTWYYLDSRGYMATGWLRQSNTWCYLKSSGAIATGWIKLGNTWYYLKSSGAMATGWIKLGNTWYWLDSSGAMATGARRIGGKTYRFDSGGRWLG